MSIARRDFLKGSAAGAVAALLPACEESGRTGKGASASSEHRYIDEELCIACRLCLPLCPMGAIGMSSELAWIDSDECAECGVCVRSGVCPEDAIKEAELSWPRLLRATFSNPLAEHKSTGVRGRGTEGIKTNDSTDHYRAGLMGVFVELGRPVLGARFLDAERVVKKFTAHGYSVLEENPVAELITDRKTGALRSEILNEKAISILIEFILPDTAAIELLAMVAELSDEVDSIFNVSVALRADPEGRSPLRGIFGPGIPSLPNGKVNIGLGHGIDGREA
jgi:ferredoxin